MVQGTRYNPIVSIRTEEYGMSFDDQTIAQMVKCYLKSLPQMQAKKLLGRAVNPKIIAFGFKKKEETPKALWTEVQCVEVARIIDLARKNCQEEMDSWDGSGHLCKRTKCFIEDEIIAQNPGEVYVKGMPVEFAEFLLDCYFRAR